MTTPKAIQIQPERRERRFEYRRAPSGAGVGETAANRGFNRVVRSSRTHEVSGSESGLAAIAGGPSWAGNVCRATMWQQGAGAIGAARQAERTRIAQELHDTLLQGFCSLSMQLHAAVNAIPQDSLSRPRFDGLVQLMGRVLEQGRLAVQGLRSQQDLSSLSDAFASVPSELGLSPAVRFRVSVQGRQTDLKASLREDIYCIGREAIVNAYRHSGAKDIDVALQYRPAGLRIVVRDNGCGMDSQQLHRGQVGHWGVQGMRERAERIGAQLRIRSSVETGTEVELCVPGPLGFVQDGLRAAS